MNYWFLWCLCLGSAGTEGELLSGKVYILHPELGMIIIVNNTYGMNVMIQPKISSNIADQS